MTFNAAIPQSTDLISQSQSQILTNFSQSNTAFGIDHTAFDVVTNQGKHKKSTYLDQGVDPTTLANEIALYSKSLAGVSTLYMRKESNGTVIQMSGAGPLAAADGSTFLPGGIFLKWGSWTLANGVPTAAVGFAGGAFPTALFALTFGSNVSGSPNNLPIFTVGTADRFGFTAGRVTGSSGGTYTYNYIAIGN